MFRQLMGTLRRLLGLFCLMGTLGVMVWMVGYMFGAGMGMQSLDMATDMLRIFIVGATLFSSWFVMLCISVAIIGGKK